MMDAHWPLQPLTPAESLQKIRAGEVLRGYHLLGTINLRQLATEDAYFPVPLIIEHCRVDHLDAVLVTFQRPVALRHVHIARADFSFAHFLQGLHMEACTFESYLDFQAGGHNKPGFPVQLLGNDFGGFVNFFDCWYEAVVCIEGNTFRQGSNLLGAPEGYPVTFDAPLQANGNTGKLDYNEERRAEGG